MKPIVRNNFSKLIPRTKTTFPMSSCQDVGLFLACLLMSSHVFVVSFCFLDVGMFGALSPPLRSSFVTSLFFLGFVFSSFQSFLFVPLFQKMQFSLLNHLKSSFFPFSYNLNHSQLIPTISKTRNKGPGQNCTKVKLEEESRA